MQIIGNKKTMPLFVQRTAAHYPYNAQCAIISQLKSDASKTLITFFNPLDGVKIKEYQNSDLILDFKIKQVYLANIADNHFLKPLIILDHLNEIHILPKTSQESIYRSKRPHSIYTVDKNSLSGYSISQNNAVSVFLLKLNP